jgi:hypothetical protein
MAEESKGATPAFAQGPQVHAPAPREFPVDISRLSTAYANFVRVTGTPEELVLDFGLSTQVAPTATEPVALTHRLVLNFYTAKRLLGALHMAVQQHEAHFGVLETDVQKRAKPQTPAGGGRPGLGVSNPF